MCINKKKTKHKQPLGVNFFKIFLANNLLLNKKEFTSFFTAQKFQKYTIVEIYMYLYAILFYVT